MVDREARKSGFFFVFSPLKWRTHVQVKSSLKSNTMQRAHVLSRVFFPFARSGAPLHQAQIAATVANVDKLARPMQTNDPF